MNNMLRGDFSSSLSGLFFAVTGSSDSVGINRMLKETYYAIFQAHNFILDYYYNRLGRFNLQKTHPFSHPVQCSSSGFLPSSGTLCFSSCLFKALLRNMQIALAVSSCTPEPAPLTVTPVCSVVF